MSIANFHEYQDFPIMHDQVDFALGAAIVARNEFETGTFEMCTGEILRPCAIQRLSHPRGAQTGQRPEE